MKYHPDVLAAHAEFGGDLQAMQALYDRPDHIDRIAALEAQNKLWQQNMREAYEAFTAMRNDLNELFPMQSAEADLLEGPEWSVTCAAIVDAARDRFAAIEAQLAERDADLAEFGRRLGPRWFLEQNWFPATLSALSTPPAPKVTDAMVEAAVSEWLSHTTFSLPEAMRAALTAAQEAGKP